METVLARVDAQPPERRPELARELVTRGAAAVGACVERIAGACSGDWGAAGAAQSQVLFAAQLGLQLLARAGQAEDVLPAKRLAAPVTGAAARRG